MRKLFNQFLLIPLILAGVGFFITPHVAHAAGVVDGAINLLIGGTDVFYGLIGKIFWWVLIPLAGQILALVGTLMDYALFVATLPTVYNSEVITVAWTIIRDVANMLFIFILVFNGVKTILSIGNASSIKKTITSVIIAALLLNFSLFFTKIFIDVSNTGASWFIQGVKSIGGQESVSSSVRASLRMERLTATYGEAHLNDKSFSLQSFVQGFLLFILTLIAIYVFYKVADLIMGRIVAFIILLITSPIGFTGIFLDLGDISEYAKKWWKEMTGQMFMLPMFFLALYITMFLVDRFDKIFPTTTSAGGGFEPVNYFMFGIIIMLLLRSLKIAEEYSGELGGMTAKFLQQGTALVTGSIAMGTIGKAASAIQNNTKFQAWSARNGALGEVAMRSARGVASADFAVKSNFGALTKDTPLAKNALTKDAFKGSDKGYSGKIDQEKKDLKDYAKSLGKGLEGAQNRQAFAANLQSGLYSRVLNGAKGITTGTISIGKKAIDKATGSSEITDAIKNSAITSSIKDTARFTAEGAKQTIGYIKEGANISTLGATGLAGKLVTGMANSQGIAGAKKEMEAEANKEVIKEEGKIASTAIKEVNERMGGDNRTEKALKKEADTLEERIQRTEESDENEIERLNENLERVSESLASEKDLYTKLSSEQTQQTQKLIDEEAKLTKHLSTFNASNYTVNGAALFPPVFEKQRADAQSKLKEVQDQIDQSKPPQKPEKMTLLEQEQNNITRQIEEKQKKSSEKIAELKKDKKVILEKMALRNEYFAKQIDKMKKENGITFRQKHGKEEVIISEDEQGVTDMKNYQVEANAQETAEKINKFVEEAEKPKESEPPKEDKGGGDAKPKA